MTRSASALRRRLRAVFRLGAALVVVLALTADVSAQPAAAQTGVGEAAAAAAAASAFGQGSFYTGITWTSFGPASGGALAACTASVVCAGSVIVGALVVGGLVYWAMQDPDADVPADAYAEGWEWLVLPTWSAADCRVRFTMTAPPPPSSYNGSYPSRTVRLNVGGGQMNAFSWTSGQPYVGPLVSLVNGACPIQGVHITYGSGSSLYCPLRFGVAALSCNSATPYGPTGTTVITPPPSPPLRTMTSTGTCVLPDGSFVPATPWVSAPYRESDPPAIRPPLCAPGTALATVRVVQTAPGLPDKVLLDSGQYVAPTLSDGSPSPCGAAQGWACELDLQQWSPARSDWASCTLDSIDCTAVTAATLTSTTVAATHRCALVKAGTLVEVRPLADCTAIAGRDYAPGSTPVATVPNPNEPNQGTYVTAPPVASPEDCAPSGWAILNPFSYVRSTACLFSWAFVPSGATLTATLQGLRDDFYATPVGSAVGDGYSALQAFFTAYDDGTCTTADEARVGYELDGSPGTWVGLPCQNPIGPAYAPVFVILSGAIVLGTVWRLWAIARGAFSGTGEEQ